MAHTHDPHETTVITDGHGGGYGIFVAIAAILAIVVIGLAVLWAEPWEDDGNDVVPNPDITDDSGGDVPVPDVPNPDVPAPDGGGEGGGEQPAR